MVRMPGQGAEQRAGFQLRKDYQPQITSQELSVMVGNSLNTLLEAIKSGNTERLTQYLAFSSRFHRYSRRNQQLIFSQCPEATRVASYVKWKEEGYHVRKMEKEHGEHGIRILVPKFPKFYKKPYRRQPESQEGAEPEEKREDEYTVGFL
jgi:hypothetical protein